MKKSILLYLLISSLQINGFNHESLDLNVQAYKKKSGVNSHVAFVQDETGTRYVVKQYRHKRRRLVLPTTISEFVALDMGNAVGTPLDTAYLIPAGVPFVGKDFEIPATLHAFVSGTSYKSYKGEKYKNISIFQSDGVGLTREIIYHMSRHKDLPYIAALDTFVGNNDRGRHNYYYHESTDSFIGIDMGAAFKRDFCKPTHTLVLQLLTDENTSFSEQEKEGLTIYYKTLKQLVDNYPPELLCNQIDEYAHLAGFFDEQFFTPKLQKRWAGCFAGYKKYIHKSYPYAQELVAALESLLKKHNAQL